MSNQPSAKQQYLNYAFLRRLRTKTVADLNKLCVFIDLNAKGLKSLRTEIDEAKRRTVPIKVVTRYGETIETTKRKAKIKELIDDALDQGLYKTGLISAVALIENFLVSELQIILTAYPRKIGKDKKLGVDELLSSSDHKSALLILVQKEITSAMYKKPVEYLAYLENIVSIKLEKNMIQSYAEIKATRDLLVHAQGVVNDSYLEKAGNAARGALGLSLKVNKIYFDQSITKLKDLVHTIFETTLLVHGNREELREIQQYFAKDI